MKKFIQFLSVLPTILAFAAIASAQQVHIKGRFLEVPKGTVAGFGNLLNSTNSAVGQFTGILNETNTRTILCSLELRKDVEALGEPEVITTSGRQTEMRATELISVVTKLLVQNNATTGSDSVVPQTEPIETGPVLDVVPHVLSDGHTINLTLISSLTEFLGYDQPPANAPCEHVNDAGDHLPVVLPKFRVHQAEANANLSDGQTMVLSRFEDHSVVAALPPGGLVRGAAPNAKDKELLVFITVNLVDSAGNRIHPEN
jgi:Flp pilus assembly secretin CpaC